jgi:ribosomal protein S18 acetylase RimI-like enzyme
MTVMSRIRPRSSSDLNELVDVAARVHAVDGYPAYLPGRDFYRFLTDPGPLAAWVAEDDGRIVGHIAVNSHSHRAVMEVVRRAGIPGRVGVVARLLVDPGVRRQGVGAALLEQAREHIVCLGRIPVLDVVASATPAVSLYQDAGWRKIGEALFVVPGHAITELIFAAPDSTPHE